LATPSHHKAPCWRLDFPSRRNSFNTLRTLRRARKLSRIVQQV
jgi:hypothetical protein